MKAVVSNRPPCRLDRGELRRVPQNRLYGIVGYHVCCPRCGFVTVALTGRDDLNIDESDSDQVSFSKPIRCIYCNVLIHLSENEYTLEEDEHVRSVQYR